MGFAGTLVHVSIARVYHRNRCNVEECLWWQIEYLGSISKVKCLQTPEDACGKCISSAGANACTCLHEDLS